MLTCFTPKGLPAAGQSCARRLRLSNYIARRYGHVNALGQTTELLQGPEEAQGPGGRLSCTRRSAGRPDSRTRLTAPGRPLIAGPEPENVRR